MFISGKHVIIIIVVCLHCREQYRQISNVPKLLGTQILYATAPKKGLGLDHCTLGNGPRILSTGSETYMDSYFPHQLPL